MHKSTADRILSSKIFSLIKGKTAKSFSEDIGASEKLLSSWKVGRSRPTLDHLRKIIEATGVSWDYLMNDAHAESDAPGLDHQGIAKSEEQFSYASRLKRVMRLEGMTFSQVDKVAGFEDGRSAVCCLTENIGFSEAEWDRVVKIFPEYRAYLRTGKHVPVASDQLDAATAEKISDLNPAELEELIKLVKHKK